MKMKVKYNMLHMYIEQIAEMYWHSSMFDD